MDRTLILLRHAKSDWSEDVPDHDRPLAKRGRKNAPEAGRWLRLHDYLPDVVICSTARRTRETWALVAGKLGETPAVIFEPRAYAASAQTLLYLARELPSACRTGLLIAHNPGISELATSLAEAEPESGRVAGTTRQVIGFPTTGLGVLTFAGDWADLAPGGARLAAFVTPADM